ncbi:hypothetical protein BSR28_00255 [Boudabousia liubingyangii]|uniref:variant leucine-rich repeat-containing protein n=1 Tax=Boudabousia liubingyangii TaxID=1921764 RepID=UPI00093928E9|nr:hypothetical protein [Boudabousia liubingyangii]OKL48184.1 hypothetical protein BSR28_00255 [Boudabousia liubingyangii]
MSQPPMSFDPTEMLLDNPNLEPQALTEIVNSRPDLWQKVARHPKVSPALLRYLQTHGDPQTKAEVSRRLASEIPMPGSNTQVEGNRANNLGGGNEPSHSAQPSGKRKSWIYAVIGLLVVASLLTMAGFWVYKSMRSGADSKSHNSSTTETNDGKSASPERVSVRKVPGMDFSKFDAEALTAPDKRLTLPGKHQGWITLGMNTDASGQFLLIPYHFHEESDYQLYRVDDLLRGEEGKEVKPLKTIFPEKQKGKMQGLIGEYLLSLSPEGKVELVQLSDLNKVVKTQTLDLPTNCESPVLLPSPQGHDHLRYYCFNKEDKLAISTDLKLQEGKIVVGETTKTVGLPDITLSEAQLSYMLNGGIFSVSKPRQDVVRFKSSLTGKSYDLEYRTLTETTYLKDGGLVIYSGGYIDVDPFTVVLSPEGDKLLELAAHIRISQTLTSAEVAKFLKQNQQDLSEATEQGLKSNDELTFMMAADGKVLKLDMVNDSVMIVSLLRENKGAYTGISGTTFECDKSEKGNPNLLDCSMVPGGFEWANSEAGGPFLLHPKVVISLDSDGKTNIWGPKVHD